MKTKKICVEWSCEDETIRSEFSPNIAGELLEEIINVGIRTLAWMKGTTEDKIEVLLTIVKTK